MRHKVHKYGLGVTRGHRKAMMANMAASLITHERIQTTLTKARALRPFIEKVITKAKKAGLAKDKKDAIHLRRLALADVRNETAITKLFNETWKQFEARNGGYTRIYKLGRRDSDAAEVAIIEFVKADDPGYKKSRSRARKAGKKALQPAAEKPAGTAAEKPAEAAVPAEASTAETPAETAAPAGAPATEAPTTGAPAAEAPVAETPATEAPAAEGEPKV